MQSKKEPVLPAKFLVVRRKQGVICEVMAVFLDSKVCLTVSVTAAVNFLETSLNDLIYTQITSPSAKEINTVQVTAIHIPPIII